MSFMESWQEKTRQLEAERQEILQRVGSARTLMEGLEDELERIRLLIGHEGVAGAAAPVSANPSASGESAPPSATPTARAEGERKVLRPIDERPIDETATSPRMGFFRGK